MIRRPFSVLMALGVGIMLMGTGCAQCGAPVSEDKDAGPGGPGGAASSGGGIVRRDGGGTLPSDDGGDVGGGSSSGQGGGSSSSSSGSSPMCGNTEHCADGLDNNCNGEVDEGCACTPGETQECYDGDPARAGVGVCVKGTMECVFIGEDVQWGPCEGSGQPQEVVCGGGMDYRCTGIIDEGCPCQLGTTRACYGGPAGTENVGACHGGVETCIETPQGNEFGPCEGQVVPAAEMCDGQDHDCNGTANNGCSCTLGESRSCYTGPAGTNGQGVCHGGTQECVATAGGADWGPCNGEVTPSMEQCDGQDWNCDGTPNTGCGCTLGATQACYSGPAGTNGVGACHGGMQTCISMGGTSTWGPCSGEVTPQANACDGVDRACTGNPSEGCACTLGATQGCYTGPNGTDGVGACHAGTRNCDVINNSIGWTGCNNQQTPVTEICGNDDDDDCDGQRDEGCGGMVMCPGDQQVLAGQPIQLSVTNMGLTNLQWSITNGPTGGAGSVVWSPDPPTSTTETFTAFIVGVYTVRVSGRDQNGQTQSCSFNVTAISHGLRVELTWNGTGDVDLHLHNANMTPWFGVSPGRDDCFYGNKDTSWGANLDVDNTVADGPENIRIDNPVVSSPYTIGVHNYARAAGRIATVKLFCGTTAGTTPTRTFNSRALEGTASGQSTSNDFWKVARVTFNSDGTCNVTVLDSYTTGSAVYTAF